MAPALTIDERDWKQAFMLENATFRIIKNYNGYGYATNSTLYCCFSTFVDLLKALLYHNY